MVKKRAFKVVRPGVPQQTLRERIAQCKTVDDVVAVLRERFFVITVGLSAKVVVGDERHDRGEALRLYPFAEFKKRYLPYGFTYKDKFLDIGTIYVRHPQPRQYDGQLVFRPDGSPFAWDADEDYNLWRGLAVKAKRGDWSLLQKHIFENLCNKNREHQTYLLNWMAHLVQFPGRLPGVAVCLHGGQGTGKGTFYQCLADLFPQDHVIHVTKPEHLVGRFNAHLSAKVLVFADEATFAGDKKILGELNAIITERKRGVERKNIDVTSEENCVHLIMASNNEWFVHASRDARRFFVLKVSAARAQDTQYFDAIMAQQANGGREAMLYDLMRRDLSAFNPFHVPKTDALLDQISHSREPHETWWKEKLTDATASTWKTVVVKKNLHHDYLEWMKQMQHSRPLSKESFSKYLIGLYGHDVARKGRMRINGRQEHMYEFPSLSECRRRFDPRERWPDELRIARKKGGAR